MSRVSVLPAGTNAAGDVIINGDVDRRTVSIRLLGPSNTVAPTAEFTISPDGTTIGQFVTFDASGSEDEGEACLAKCVYAWSFGDGATALGRNVSHQFLSAGTFQVTLTVADPSGTTDSISHFVTVGLGDPPAAMVTCSPSDPVPDQLVVCDASGSTSELETGATIVSYVWSWGDGNTLETGDPVAAHPAGGYAQDGTYTVSVTVTDTYGRKHTATASVAVTTPEP
jgi:PKD repeat protein